MYEPNICFFLLLNVCIYVRTYIHAGTYSFISVIDRERSLFIHIHMYVYI